MADKEQPEEAEQTEEELQAAVAKAAKKKKLMVLGAVGLVLLLVAGGGTWFALKSFGGKPKVEAAAGEEKHDEKAAEHGEEHGEEKTKGAFYDALEPAFLANFMVNGRQRYLQVSLTAMARDEGGVAALNTHMPLVRNRIVMQLSGEQFDQLQTDDGRQQLQQKLLASIQEIMNKETGKPQIDQVYFTAFVMQ